MWKKIPGLLFDIEGETLQKYSSDKDVLEIGSFMGKSSVAIAQTAKSLTCVDTFKGSPSNSEDQSGSTYLEFKTNIKKAGIESKIKTFQGTSDRFFKETKKRKVGHFDFIFIDGLHTYEQVKKDIINAKKHLREGGFIACHDFNNIEKHAGVKKAVNELLEIVEKAGTLAICR